jgi:virginiamycin B lyase
VKKQTKGILAFIFLGGIMVTSGVVIAFPGIDPGTDSSELTITGTPADNFTDDERA